MGVFHWDKIQDANSVPNLEVWVSPHKFTVNKSIKRVRFPAWLKRWLIPIWNRGYHQARWVNDRLLAAMRWQVDHCDVCGRFALMIYRRRVIPPELARRWGLTEPLAQAVARKESLECLWCGTKLRGRRLARVLLESYPTTASVRSVAAWVRTPEAAQLRIAEINRIDGLHAALTPLRHFTPSDHLEGAEPGTVVAGVRHEDLNQLSHRDASFDLVLTSETLEHVPDLAQALAEIYRILVPGGRHIFTIPLLPTTPTTFARARRGEAGELINLTLPIRHPGGDSGWPVFTEFGSDFPKILEHAGFEVQVWFGPTTYQDVAQVVLTRKPTM